MSAHDERPEANPLGLTAFAGTAAEGAWNGGFGGPKNAAAIETYTGEMPNGLPDGFNAMNALGGVTSALGTYSAFRDLFDPSKSGLERGIAGANAYSGATGTAGAIAHQVGAENAFFRSLGTVGGDAGLGGAVTTETFLGKAGAGAASRLGTLAGTTGALAGAGLFGFQFGDYGAKEAEQRGWYGKNEDGSKRSSTEEIRSWGRAANDWAGGGVVGTGAEVLADVGGVAVESTKAVAAGTLGAAESFGSALIHPGAFGDEIRERLEAGEREEKLAPYERMLQRNQVLNHVMIDRDEDAAISVMAAGKQAQRVTDTTRAAIALAEHYAD